jgi:hypothetical protein
LGTSLTIFFLEAGIPEYWQVVAGKDMCHGPTRLPFVNWRAAPPKIRTKRSDIGASPNLEMIAPIQQTAKYDFSAVDAVLARRTRRRSSFEEAGILRTTELVVVGELPSIVPLLKHQKAKGSDDIETALDLHSIDGPALGIT